MADTHNGSEGANQLSTDCILVLIFLTLDNGRACPDPPECESFDDLAWEQAWAQPIATSDPD